MKQLSKALVAIFFLWPALSCGKGKEFDEMTTCILKPRVHMSRVMKLLSKPLISRFNKANSSDFTSLNWSGYTAFTGSSQNPTNNVVSSASGQWVVPAILSSASNATIAIWVGIDGFVSATVEATGVAIEIIGGKPHYFAWIDIDPYVFYEISGFPVNPGDTMHAEVRYIGNNTFKMIIKNITQHKIYKAPTSITVAKHPVQRSSAEWVVEGNVGASLPNFGCVKWSDCSTTINGKRGAISDKHWEDGSIAMVSAGGIIKDQPSALSCCGSAFTVTWKHA